MINLDGSTLEGGGQLVRVALSVSAICSIPIRITNIRAGRGPQSFLKGTRTGSSSRGGHGSTSNYGRSRVSKKSAVGGGVKESHLAALDWLARESNAKVEGAEVGSQEVVFKPRPRRPVEKMSPILSSNEPEMIELRNPGSIWLIWQAVFPYVVFSMLDNRSRNPAQPAFRIRLKGGTNVPKSPSSEYMQQVFLPLCEKIGLPKVHVAVIKRGWTTGAPELGEVEITVFQQKPVLSENTKDEQSQIAPTKEDSQLATEDSTFHLLPFHIKGPSPFTIASISVTTISGSQQTHSLLQTCLRNSLRAIPHFSSSTLPITTHPSSTPSSGDERRLYILLTAQLADGYILGRDYLAPGRKITDEADRRRMVDEAVNTVVRDLKREVERERCVDEFAEDQLVVFQALADWKSFVDGGRSNENGKGKGGAGETGSLHTRTVRWVCNEILGTKFDGMGGCEGGGLLERDGGVADISKGIGRLGVKDDVGDADGKGRA